MLTPQLPFSAPAPEIDPRDPATRTRKRRVLHVAADALHLVPVRLRPDLVALGDTIVRRLPFSLQRDLARGIDRAVRDAAEAVGSPALGDSALADALLGVPGWAMRHGGVVNGQRGGPGVAPVPVFAAYFPQIDPNALPMPRGGDPAGASPAFGFGAPGDDGMQNMAAAQNVRRSPFVIWGGTDIEEGFAGDANANDYTNTSQRRFIITHVTLSQTLADADATLQLAPQFKLQVTPSVTNRPWMRSPVLTTALLSSVPYGNVPNLQGYDVSRWAFPFEYRLGRNQANAVAVGNEAATQAATIGVALIGYKEDAVGTPRVFFDSTSVAANSSSGTYLNGQQFRGDGDFDVMLTDMVMQWDCVTPTSPLIFVRPDQASQWMNQQNGVPAAAMNNVVGALGAYWELRRPQLIEAATSLTVTLQGPTGIADCRANVGFLGYIEEPA